jgi:seryl-tRNA synthetase
MLERVPDGRTEHDNVIVREWGASDRLIGMEGSYLWHDDIAKGLGGIDTSASSKIAGSRFSVLIGVVARLERALIQYFMDFHTQRGYQEVSVPYMVRESSLEGTGQLPRFREEVFSTNHSVGNEPVYLIPTAEVPITNLFREELLEETALPISLVACTPCFRAEVGSAGRDTRGFLRQHQFHKVELVCSITDVALYVL